MTVGRSVCLSFQVMDEITKRKRSLKIREALGEVVHQAFKQQRLVQGVLDATNVLRRHPKDVMFVVLEQVASDKKELEIQEKLIHAYCTEKCVKMIKVNRCAALLHSLKQEPTTQDLPEEIHSVQETNTCQTHEHKTIQTIDNQCEPVHCILVRKPEMQSNEDSFLIAFYDILVSSNIVSCPIIRV